MRVGLRICKSAARREPCPERRGSAIRNCLNTLRALARSPAAGPAALGPAGPRGRPAHIGPEVIAHTDAASASPGLARGITRGAITPVPCT
jgi:hypothetical protein